ncbi:DNA cytosine methyltransferase [Comamonas thiooxydans]|nr:DNA cytosine methyltransferase [Comamonas thiooxydans]
MSMHTVTTRKLSERDGSPRLWLEGKRLLNSGFEPGHQFVVEPYGLGVVLKLQVQGTNKVSRRERKKDGRIDSIIDVRDSTALAPLMGCKAIRVVFGERQVFVSPMASELRLIRRVKRLMERLKAGKSLATAGVASGGGVLDHALHAGLRKAGIKAHLHAFNEIREDLTEQALEHNELLNDSTIVLNLPLQELAFDEMVMDRIGEVDVVCMGLPCSGASKAGRAKRRTDMPEAHPEVGHLVAGAVALLAKLNASVCIFENVIPWGNSASACILRQQLRDMAYETHERVLSGPEFGDLEARERFYMVAVSRGMDFDFDAMASKPACSSRTLADVLEPEEVVKDRWSTMDGLKAKQERDKEAGKNFMMRVFKAEDTFIGGLTKGMTKNRSTDPKIQHPTNPELLRVPTAIEHAACKGIPKHLIEGLPQTKANELLGQSVTYGAASSLGEHAGREILRWANSFGHCVKTALQQLRKTVPVGQSELFSAAA